jgi:hypothetical protein
LAWRDREKQKHLDLESLEIHIRGAMHEVGSVMLEKLINADGGDYRGTTLPCEHGHDYAFKGYRDKRVLTVLGWVTLRRAYYYDSGCKQGHCPKDRDLDIEETIFSPGVRRMMGKVGAYRPFGQGAEDLKELAGIEVNGKAIERVSYGLGGAVESFHQREAAGFVSGKVVPILNKPIPKMYIGIDGTGVPMVRAETVNRRGKGGGEEEAKTRQVKLGCIFTQTGFNKEGLPVRDEDSTSYVGAIEGADEFGYRLYGEALRRGLEKAQKVCAMGDGATWIWNIAEEHFYGAIQIIDLYHAREHYWEAARSVFGADQDSLKQWTEARRKELDSGKVEKVIEAIRNLCPTSETQEKVLKGEIGYFEKNMERMRYEDFKKQGLFVGSGVVEAGCRSVIGIRLKQSGMHWTVKGANHITNLRSCILSARWEDFWENRASG